MPTQTCAMCGWTGPQHKMMRWNRDWVKPGRGGSLLLHSKWACRDKAACQERQDRRKETTAG